MGHKNTERAGYQSFDYAQSFAEFATPRYLANCGGAILERIIPGTSMWDAMGPYPLFCCSELDKLRQDLDAAASRLVSFFTVIDPFISCSESALVELFPDRVLRFKEHFVTDLSQDPGTFVSPHHRRNASKALRAVRVEIAIDPPGYLDQWLSLYSGLVKRHAIGDLRSFSRCAFERQLRVPGVRAFVAHYAGQVVGMLLWYVQGEVAYYHLGAYSDKGYELGASFALFHEALHYFRNTHCKFLCLGAGAGTAGGSDGLARFKQGWSTGTRPVYFCGKILNRDAYDELVRTRGIAPTDYFPAYRQGEFCKKKN